MKDVISEDKIEDKMDTQIETSLRNMYELGKKHGYQKAIDDLRLQQMQDLAPTEQGDK